MARRERRRQRAMRRRRYALVPAVLLVLVLLAVLGASLRARHHTTQPPAPVRAAPASPPPSTLLLAHRSPANRVDLAVVVGASAGADGGAGTAASIVLVPTRTATETPSFGLQLVADVLTLGPPQLLHTTVENALGVGIDATAVLDTPTLLALMDSAGPLDVNLRDAVEVPGTPQGRVFPGGPQQITPSDATTLLTATAPTGELDHLVTVQAIFEGWMRALLSPQVATASTSRVPELATLVSAAHATTKFSTLPVDAVTAAEAGERYQVRPDADLAPAMRTAFPGRVLGIDGRRPRVEILSGTAAAGPVQQAAAKVARAGGHVVKTGNAPTFGRPVTQVVYYRDSARAAAASLLAAIGAGQLFKEPVDIGVFDVTIIPGADFSPAPGT